MDDIGILTRNHGFLHGFLLNSENPEEFHAVYNGLLYDHQPIGVLERHLVTDIAMSLWRLRRVRSRQVELADDFASFDRLSRHRSAILHELHRATMLLKNLQQDRTSRRGKARLIAFPVLPSKVARKPA